MNCPRCNEASSVDEVGTWPHACRVCISKNFAGLYRLQAEGREGQPWAERVKAIKRY